MCIRDRYLSSDGAGAADAGTVTEDDALSITLTATDEESADVTFSKTSGGTCPSWITLTDGGNAAQTATLTALAGEITDARVGDHTCDITMTDGTSNTLDTHSQIGPPPLNHVERDGTPHLTRLTSRLSDSSTRPASGPPGWV